VIGGVAIACVIEGESKLWHCDVSIKSQQFRGWLGLVSRLGLGLVLIVIGQARGRATYCTKSRFKDGRFSVSAPAVRRGQQHDDVMDLERGGQDCQWPHSHVSSAMRRTVSGLLHTCAQPHVGLLVAQPHVGLLVCSATRRTVSVLSHM
jgi:hypothetical protein